MTRGRAARGAICHKKPSGVKLCRMATATEVVNGAIVVAPPIAPATDSATAFCIQAFGVQSPRAQTPTASRPRRVPLARRFPPAPRRTRPRLGPPRSAPASNAAIGKATRKGSIGAQSAGRHSAVRSAHAAGRTTPAPSYRRRAAPLPRKPRREGSAPCQARPRRRHPSANEAS